MFQLGLNTIWTKLNIHKWTVLLVTIPSIIIAVFVLPVLLILLSVAWIYRQIAHIILTLTLGDKYMGLITGCNVIVSLGEDEEPAVITLMSNLISDKNGSEIYSAVKDRFKYIMESTKYEKLFTVRKMYMGFIYLEKHNFEINEIITSITDEEIRGFMNEHCHREMPALNTGNIDVYVGRTISINGGYPIVVRVHHCLTDGLSLYNLIGRIFCLPNISKEDYATNLSDGIKKNFTEKTILESINRFRYAKITSLFPVTCHNDIFSKRNKNRSDTILTYSLENEEKSVPTIKRIKRRFPNMHFNTIVLTAISASLAEFYLKKREFNEIPELIHTLMMAQVDHRRFKPAFSSEDEIEMTNDFSFLYPQITVIPTELREKPIEEYLVDRLLIIHEEFNRIMESSEYIIKYTMFNTLASLFPICVLKPLSSLGRMTVAFSSMPGGPANTFITGDKIQDVIYFIPKQAQMGVCLTILTYNNKLQLGLKACRDKCNNIEELDAILKGVYKYIDILDQKTANY